MTTPSAQSYPKQSIRRVHAATALEKTCPDENCPYSGEPQPLSNFYKNAARYDGLQNYCKDCSRRINNERRLIPKNPVTDGEKVCSACKLSQPVDNFAIWNIGRGGRYPRCKSCVIKFSAAYYIDNREFINKRNNYHRLSVRDQSANTLQAYWDSLAAGASEQCKICIMCGGDPQPYSNFQVNLDYSDGLSRKCKQCLRQIERNRYYANKKYNWPKRTIHSIRSRANEKGIPFNIDVSDLQQPEYCPIFGVKLDYLSGPDRRLWASVDRIKPEIGYVRGNVRIISNAANNAKLDGDDSIFSAIKSHHSC